ncbi:uncharacterized protein LOC133189848 [Saccostrea echinata]|uniref:uncharacterized protein LOC133189848 n=1 Tax=Saccostrea echinata TaxID=191078 RepID=UPI002A8313C4|nr:uncharacterized protein LOC133189848 [Saccostrea echinata]
MDSPNRIFELEDFEENDDILQKPVVEERLPKADRGRVQGQGRGLLNYITGDKRIPSVGRDRSSLLSKVEELHCHEELYGLGSKSRDSGLMNSSTPKPSGINSRDLSANDRMHLVPVGAEDCMLDRNQLVVNQSQGYSKCAVRTCSAKFSGATPMFTHIWEFHAKGIDDIPVFLNFLMELAETLWLTPQSVNQDATLEQLRLWVEQRMGKVEWSFSVQIREVMYRLSMHLGVNPPLETQLRQVRMGWSPHVAMLAHPLVMAILINGAKFMGDWYELDQSQSNFRECWESELPEHIVGEWPNSQVLVVQDSMPNSLKELEPALKKPVFNASTLPSLPVSNVKCVSRSDLHSWSRDTGLPLLQVVDCLWHPGRMPSIWGRDVNKFLSDDKCPIEEPVGIIGGCVGYGFHEEPLPDISNYWVVAKGIRPGEVDFALPRDVANVVATCRDKNWVVGDIGLDYSEVTSQCQQRFVLAEFFRRADFNAGMVLLLKGSPDDPLGLVPTQDCLTLLDGLFVPTLVPVYLHNFTGGPEQVRIWTKSGRPVFFGVSGHVTEMSAVQIAGVQEIPGDRLLVESNSPNRQCGVEFPMSPQLIGKVYQKIAEIRNENVAQLAGRVYQNFRMFFEPQLRGNL